MASPIVRLDENEKRIVEIAKGLYNATTQEDAIKRIIREHSITPEFKKGLDKLLKKIEVKKSGRT
jgi:hypothetical protein